MKTSHNLILTLAMLLMTVIPGTMAQNMVVEGYRTSTLTPEAEAYFMSLIPKKDSTYILMSQRGRRNTTIKRFSLRTNMLNWLLLLPNFGIEYDLNNTPRTHWSIALSGCINPKTNNTFSPNFVVNINSVRFEGRKYWRTGRYGKTVYYHDDYVRLVTDRRRKDYNADSLASKFYNWYNRVRRNTFSGRTADNPRNWRAYYITMWAAWDHYSLTLSNKGSQGYGISFGTGFGYTIPLFPQRFPNEGSLDLDLGIDIGLRLTKYDAYTYDGTTGCYVYDASRSRGNWTVLPFPVIQDIRLGLVWRFRSIKNKVDLSLVDDYEKTIEAFKERQRIKSWTRDSLRQRAIDVADSLRQRGHEIADSIEYWNGWNIRRLKAARILVPDTVFCGRDAILDLKLIQNVTDPKLLKEAEKKIQQEERHNAATAFKRKKKR